MQAARIDPSARNPIPPPSRVVLAAVAAVALSLAADALIVVAGTRAFPSTRGYAHFRFSDYATLTIIGVSAACSAWPIVVRISTSPRWLLLRLAVAVTLVLWLPDLDLLLRHQPVRAVLVLMVMHLAVAIVTYNLLVRIAPPPPTGSAAPPDAVPEAGDSAARFAWLLEALVGIEVILGIVALVVVPTGRSSGLLPSHGAVVYVVHFALGVALALGAIAYLARVWDAPRITLLSGWIGFLGVVVGGVGGLLTAAHPLRLVGIALMLAGGVAAAFGYLLPALDRLSDDGTGTGG